MKARVLLPLITAAATLAVAAPALAATQEAVSENWAGYVAQPNSADGFSAVSGSWKQPSADCNSTRSDTYAAFWVGLGGGGQQSDALEQIGTQADCSASGATSYYAWYELVPSAPVKIGMTIHAGDRVYARTAVSGDRVSLFLRDETTGHTFQKTLTMTTTTPDTSTAEWIAEAPSECANGTSGECTPLPLSDFGSASFTDAHATAGGHTGSISDSHWTATAVALSPDSSGGLFGGGYGGWGQFRNYSDYALAGSSSAGAAPGALTSKGTAFTVKYGASLSGGNGSGEGQGEPQGDGYPGG
ncbi:MAG TPA: G1 family glutamic endopeptidase, partial [Solirubrobacteraceae bacterium]|nr:G1 family glutamic endopeptidase [Solirubrobacteraceae bacterium]